MPEPTGGQERTWARSRRRGPRLRHALALLIALVVGSVGAVTTASGAPICAYDVPAHSCVGVLSNEVTESGGPHTADARERSAMSVADARATSATASSPVVATEAATTAEARGGVYSLRDEAGEVVRTGRTNDLAARQAAHASDSVLGDFRFRTEYATDVYAEQRGLEQVLYDRYPGAMSENGGFNMIRGISPTNPRLSEYMQAASDYLARSGPH